MTVVVTHTTPADGTFSATGAAAWNADHALAGVGTMAEQDANAVAITGGSINNTVIGNTTPNAATFTTLTATGQTSLGGVAGAEGLRVNTVVSAVNCWLAQGSATGGGVQLRPFGSDTNTAGLISSKGTSQLSLYTNSFAQEQLRVSHTASAVNFVQVTGAVTGQRPNISAQGSDANIGLLLTAKGTTLPSVFLGSGGSTNQFVISNNGAGTNFLQTASAATTFGPSISAQGSDTNIPLVVQPKGTGALQAQLNDGTATGGNARGANAVDWQTSRNAASQVASGAQTVLGGGQNNTVASSFCALVGGLGNTSNGFGSFLGGGNSNSISGSFGVISGGNTNTSTRDHAVVLGGQANTATGFYNVIGGGFTNTGTANAAVTTQSATMNGTTAVTLSGSNASIRVGQLITGTSIATYTYVAAISGTSLTLSQAASGSSTSTLSFFTPHGVVVGGGNNQATGAYSFIGGGGDAGTASNRNVASGAWSTIGGGAKNVASGAGSTVAGGGTDGGGNYFANTASGTTSFVGGGWNNTASGTLSTIAGGTSNNASGFDSFIGGGDNHTGSGLTSAIMGGRRGTTRGLTGYHAFPACYEPLGSTTGAAQGALLVLARQTTDATATVLTSDPNAASTSNQVILPNNSAYFFRGEVVSGVTGGGNTKGWTIEGVIKRGANAASTALVGTPTVTSMYADVGAATWTIAVTADTTNGGLAVTFTGQAGTTIRTVARINTVEMTF